MMERSSSGTSGKQFDDNPSEIPLIFIPGMKGTHLSYFQNHDDHEQIHFNNKHDETNTKKKRAWLTLPSLLNFPPLPDNHPSRNLALPLTYNHEGTIQDKGHLFPDGIIDHIIDVGPIQLFPFYGHVTSYLEEANDAYYSYKNDNNNIDKRKKKTKQQQQQQPNSKNKAIFPYDWRRPVPELSKHFHEFCQMEFPNTPVQILAHSYGGLIAFDAMRLHPDKYKPGGVFVGVPFQTGTQYIQDLHRGYYTELNRCRQFTPIDQFTFSSHWIFFPLDRESVGDLFVDVSDVQEGRGDEGEDGICFQPDKSLIGKNVAVVNSSSDEESSITSGGFKLDAVKGTKIDVDFHNVQEWEELELGIFNPEYSHLVNE